MISSGLRYITIFLFFILPVAYAEEPHGLVLDDLIVEALDNNPSLKAARYQKLAVETRINQAKAWEAPQIGVEFPLTPVSSFPNPFKDSMETDYFVQQKIPFPGKTTIMAQSERSNSEMTAWSVKSLENITIRDLKNVYYDLYLVQKKIKINAESQNLMRQFAELARKQYELGKGNQADVLRAQTELSMLINEGATMKQEKQVMETMLNTILGRPPEQPLGSVPDVDVHQLSSKIVKSDETALEKRPELKAMDENIRMKDAELALAKRDYYPDIMLRLMYKSMEEGPDDYFSTMISMDIPFLFLSGGKIKGRVEESRLNVLKAKEDLRAMENMTRFQIREAMNKVDTNLRTTEFYKSTVIPQAEQTREAMGAAYATGTAELFSLIEALRTELGARENYYGSVAAYMKSLAALDQATGRDPVIHLTKNPDDPSESPERKSHE